MAEQQESSFQQWRWIIGVGLAATGSLISNLGVNLQKLTHVRNQKAKARNGGQSNKAHASPAVVPQSPSLSSTSTASDESPPARVSYWKQPLWALGLSLVVLGSIADFVALGFAAQSVVAPLGSLTLVSNVIFAPYFSGESASRHDLIATAAILLGSGTAVAFASHESDAVSFEVLFAYFTTLRFVLYAIFMTVFIAGMYYAMKTIEELAVAAEHSQQKAAEYRRVSKFHRFAYGAAAGAVGAQSVLFAKSTSELVHEGFLSMFERYESYLIFFGLASTIFLQIKWLNQGLQRFDALYMVPVFQAFWIVFSVISGLIVYDESKDMSQLNAFFFTLGVLVTVCGVYSLSQRAESHHHQLADANHQHGRRNSDIHIGLIHSDRPEQEFSALASRDLDAEFENTARDVELGDLSLPEEDQLNEEEEERLQMIAKSITTNSSASAPSAQQPRHSPTARDSTATASTSSALSPRLTSPLSVDSYADGTSEISSTLSGHLDHHHLPPSRAALNRRASPTQDPFEAASPVANGLNS